MKTKYIYEAKAMQDEGIGEWFVRLHRHLDGEPSGGGEFVGICGANGLHEAELVAACINSVCQPQSPHEDAKVLIKRMFDFDFAQERT